MTAGVAWLNVGIEARLRGMGLDELCDLAGDLAERRLRALAGEPVTRARTRRLYRLPDDDGPALFVKVQLVHARDLPFARWPRYLVHGSPLLREATAMRRLGQLGVRTPELLAFGARGRLPGSIRALLITREVPGYSDLHSVLAAGLGADAARASIAAVEATVGRLHAQGLGLNGAQYRDFLVPRSGAVTADDVIVIDCAGLGRGRRRRRRDLRQLTAQRQRGCA